MHSLAKIDFELLKSQLRDRSLITSYQMDLQEMQRMMMNYVTQ